MVMLYLELIIDIVDCMIPSLTLASVMVSLSL